MSERRSSETASSSLSYAGDISPREAWEKLAAEQAAQLVDVRTTAEWNFVGIPDLAALHRRTLLCEWQHFPAAANPAFVEEVIEALKGTSYRPGAPLVFLCRSGARSRGAAMAMTEAGYGPCFNVAQGFEGALDGQRHRGVAAGWKAQGLPWVQT